MARCLFVTGKLAAQSLRNILESMVPRLDYEMAVLPISVAALMDTRFVAKHLGNRRECDHVMIPGLCRGDLKIVSRKLGVDVIRGPKSLKEIPEKRIRVF